MHQFSTWRKSIWNWPQLSHHPGWHSLFICLSAFALISTAQYWSQAGLKIMQNQCLLRNGSHTKPSELPISPAFMGSCLLRRILTEMGSQASWKALHKHIHLIKYITHTWDSTHHWMYLHACSAYAFLETEQKESSFKIPADTLQYSGVFNAYLASQLT